MKILFLDIDGVLNNNAPISGVSQSPTLYRHKVALLNHVLMETGALVVVSSAWRYLIHRGEMNLAGLDWLLRSHGMMAGRLAGVTRADPPGGDHGEWGNPNERGQQIADWLREHPGDHTYAVLDDLDLGITAAGHPFVQTDGKLGLGFSEVRQLMAILGERPNP